MSTQIGACPACDSADVYTRRPTAQGSTASDDHAYCCQACGERFDEPHYRERKSSTDSIGKDTLARSCSMRTRRGESMTSQSSNTAVRPSDAHPECPTCETDLLVDATNLPGTYRCHGCSETFGDDRRPVAWHATDAWYVSGNSRGRTRAHADRECPNLARAETVLEWDARNARAAELGRCKRCAYTEEI